MNDVFLTTGGDTIRDRRPEGGKSTVNRQRFLQRTKARIKDAIKGVMGANKRSITDEGGQVVTVPKRDLDEPTFRHGPGGRRENIHPGNREFVAGDRMTRPPKEGRGGGKGGGQASNSGEGEDDFVFELSAEEFFNLLFEDLELPNMVKTQLAKVTEFKSVRAGFTSTGNPSALDIRRTFSRSNGRKIALKGARGRDIERREADMARLLAEGVGIEDERILLLREEIEKIQKRRVVFIEPDYDLRFRNRRLEPQPTTQAVMFCLMDVSGSMDRNRKDIAKRFFTLLYRFLRSNYEKVEVVFIRHHTVAAEVDEQTFFYGRETGGTVVSSALRLMSEIRQARYPAASWNVYVAQASDGDNWHHDSPICSDLLTRMILPFVRYYAYIEITEDKHQDLWSEYANIVAQNPHLVMRQIRRLGEIYGVFRELFSKNKRGVH